MRQLYLDDQKLADIVSAEQIIASAQSLEELRPALVAICRIIKDPIVESMRDSDIILGRGQRALD
ncbi:hypothetical protein [Sphingomonas phyllosphaerae]|uniref:hypothetical protein n=1 Tax=Sphingomonas phyllosphaerae TaxID=257003 RepID=UPI0004148162|nr:hypothetical protein [Sphingomonas phyllosphaerae]